MADSHPICDLGELAELRNGRGLSLSEYKEDGTFPVYGSNGQIASANCSNTGSAAIIVGRVGAYCGSLHFVKGPAWVTDNAIVAIAREGVDLRYLFYCLTAMDLRRAATGSAQPLVTQSALRLLSARNPPLVEQKAIASILGALDDKIDLNRQMNETLEELARTIFKSWFVDFDPVKAKTEGRQPEGMDAETAKLFPSRFVESELGMIPEGWSWIPFAETGLWVSGGTPNTKTAAYWGGSIPWISAKSMGPLWLSRSEDLLTEEGAQNGTRLVPRRSVLFIVRGMSLATEWRIGITSRDVTLNQDLKAIVDDGTVLPELVLLWLLVNREVIRAKADEAGHGTKRLPTTVLHAHSLALPPRREQEALAPTLAALLGKIELNLAESQTLAELRDLLLPKLISGELRVPDAEKLAEGVL